MTATPPSSSLLWREKEGQQHYDQLEEGAGATGLVVEDYQYWHYGDSNYWGEELKEWKDALRPTREEEVEEMMSLSGMRLILPEGEEDADRFWEVGEDEGGLRTGIWE